ncbi:MAG TPA: hypothetical protein ENK09_08375, partial [Nitrospirae bacterium]|nr:hypothetical protein [Nitrospirota bacterium]
QLKWVKKLSGVSSIRDITTGPDGMLYVLTERTVLVLNRGGEMVKTLTPPSPHSMKDPSDIAVSRDNKLYVLDRDLTDDGGRLWLVIHAFEPSGNYRKIRVLTGFKKEDNVIPSGLSLSMDGNLFIGVIKAPDDFITLYRVSFLKTPVLVQLWIFRDIVRRLINDVKDNIFIINGSGDKLSLLEYIEVVKRDSEGKFQASFTSNTIDSHKAGNAWHRFRIDGTFPEGARVKFYYYISDSREDNPDGNWIDALSSDASAQGRDKREGLFISKNKGRYLWFRIVLSGTKDRAPRVNSLSLFFPRYAYMDMLPALFREDPAGAEFLERFLSIFESFFYETDHEIAHLSRYMDALGAPQEFLDWLGRWLSMNLYEVLTNEQKRSLLIKLPELYRMRGTRRGIEEIVEIFTGKRPFVVENIFLNTPEKSKLKKAKGWCKKQEDTIFAPSSRTSRTCDGEEIDIVEKLYGSDPFSFCVLLKEGIPLPVMSALRDVLEEFRPAHTRAGVRALEPWFYLDGHTYLGVNTMLNRGYLVLEESQLGRDSTLTDMEECAQVGRKSRTEIDFNII